jgi:hypothetical protein
MVLKEWSGATTVLYAVKILLKPLDKVRVRDYDAIPGASETPSEGFQDIRKSRFNINLYTMAWCSQVVAH